LRGYVIRRAICQGDASTKSDGREQGAADRINTGRCSPEPEGYRNGNEESNLCGFAIEDKTYRDFLIGQAKNEKSPFEFVDMSVKEPWGEKWKANCPAIAIFHRLLRMRSDTAITVASYHRSRKSSRQRHRSGHDRLCQRLSVSPRSSWQLGVSRTRGQGKPELWVARVAFAGPAGHAGLWYGSTGSEWILSQMLGEVQRWERSGVGP
jgi:hypothetical protein